MNQEMNGYSLAANSAILYSSLYFRYV